MAPTAPPGPGVPVPSTDAGDGITGDMFTRRVIIVGMMGLLGMGLAALVGLPMTGHEIPQGLTALVGTISGYLVAVLHGKQ